MRIFRKGEQDKKRLRKFETYAGTDPATLKMLEEYTTTWTEEPFKLWDQAWDLSPNTPKQVQSPETYPLLCYLHLSGSVKGKGNKRASASDDD